MEAARRVMSRLRVVPLLMFSTGVVTASSPRSKTLPASNTNGLRLSSASSLGWGSKRVNKFPPIVKAGDPVLHEPAREVHLSEIKSEKVQNIIDDMIHVMRKAPGVGLAAPQIGIPFRVILNPRLKKKSNKTAFFFEGCLSVDRYQAMVERYLDVEVAGFDRYGEPIKINASGWQARILQHECDHLDGTLYVDKMVPRTFRSWKNTDMPLAHGCPKLGPRA
ncbi:peptide deformylase 1A, chloroplastic/mitochondrial-like isoform X2 [Cicer arietinum]|uniref:peptide deformylase 1A, chloroplastic/mitochondrial-like isoform X2 n=1 Tax=Cicer arietinum TaxID=3827 RepID=UPI003CC6BEA5